MLLVSIEVARTRLSELVRAVENGQTVAITRHGVPTVELVPSANAARGGIDDAAGEAYLRDVGIERGPSWVAPDFDAPLSEEFLVGPSAEREPE
jgi:prevent-host-death family protein